MTRHVPGVWTSNGVETFNPWAPRKSIEAQLASNHQSSRQTDAFGNAWQQDISWKPSLHGYGGPFGYQESPDAGLLLLGYRWLDPDVGRFLSRDPLEDGRNWYAYGAGSGSPTNFADPTGLRRFRFRPTTLYALVDNSSGEIMKYGITWYPDTRYKRWFLNQHGLKLRPLANYDDRAHALMDERALVSEMGGRWNGEPWSPYGRGLKSSGAYGWAFPVGMGSSEAYDAMAAVYAQEGSARQRRPDLWILDWMPVVGDAKGVVDTIIDFLDKYTPDIRAGMQHQRIYRWVGNE